MAKVSGTASLTIKVGLGHKKQFTQYDSASPFYSMTLEKEVPEGLSEETMADISERLTEICRERVEKKIQNDLKDLQGRD